MVYPKMDSNASAPKCPGSISTIFSMQPYTAQVSYRSSRCWVRTALPTSCGARRAARTRAARPPAESAGVSPGDELVALDGLRINLAGAEARTRRYKPGDRSELTVFRGDELMSLRLRWEEAPADTCYLVLDAEADETATARRSTWLGH